jgi:hypothetical protein
MITIYRGVDLADLGVLSHGHFAGFEKAGTIPILSHQIYLLTAFAETIRGGFLVSDHVLHDEMRRMVGL